jgi:HlyD family secretion protein
MSLLSVENGNVEISFTEAEIVDLGKQQPLKALRDITVEQVLVQEGQQVSAGTTLLILRDLKTITSQAIVRFIYHNQFPNLH